jgi:mxaD protein
MPEVHEEGEIGASVDEVWKLIGDFSGFPRAMGVPVTLSGEGIGQTREIKVGSDATVERLEELDDADRRLVYSIVKSALPVDNYRSTMKLEPVGEGRTKLIWSSTFDVREGGDEAQAATIVSAIYNGGIAGLQRHFGS